MAVWQTSRDHRFVRIPVRCFKLTCSVLDLFFSEIQRDSVLHHAFLSAYYLAREEIANQKFTSLLELEEILGIPETRRFDHRSQHAING